MTTRAKIYDKDGYEMDKGARVVRDGQFVRVPMAFSDGRKVDPEVVQQPRYLGDKGDHDERRRQLYADHDARLANAWRNDPDGDHQNA